MRSTSFVDTCGFANTCNSPQKDRAKRHVFSNRCITQKHAGYCPECNTIVSYYYGCSEHRAKKEDLLTEPVPGFVKRRLSQIDEQSEDLVAGVVEEDPRGNPEEEAGGDQQHRLDEE